MDNREIQAVLEEIAQVLQLQGASGFKVRAYENAGRAIANLQDDVKVLIDEGRLTKIRGIGKSIQAKVEELVETGSLKYLEDAKEGIPEGLYEVLKVPGIGPKKTRVMWQKLGVVSIETLEEVCREGRVAELKGFGKKTEEKILDGIAKLALTRGRKLRSSALPFARELTALLSSLDGVGRVEVAGSLRRGRETVKDVDILVETELEDASPIMSAVLEYPHVDTVIGSGERKTSVRLKNGLQVDVLVIAPRSFACALNYFTGSKEFNVMLRGMALDQGYSLNEYDLNPLDGSDPPHFETEEELMAHLGLAYVPPEMRENTGEIQLALDGKVPELVAADDLRGILHVHTRWSDGAQSVEEMVGRAAELGFQYIGISDHSVAASYANGLSVERIEEQKAEIEAARAKHPEIRVFHGIECDILTDGELDLTPECLASLDFVIASVHMDLNMARDKMTARLVKALDNPVVRVLGHPLGRKLLERDGSQFDWEPVLDVCAKHGIAIEVNGHPKRLDADWIHIRRICKRGVKLCINPDAHAESALEHATLYAVPEARRGWAGKADVINTLPVEQFERDFLRLAPA